MTTPKRHPGIESVLRHFEYNHLAEPLMQMSQHFHTLAHAIVAVIRTDDPQLTMALHKLLEAKDCAVRAYRIDLETRDSEPKPAAGQPTTSRWRPIDTAGNVAPEAAPEPPDDPDEGETGPEEIKG